MVTPWSSAHSFFSSRALQGSSARQIYHLSPCPKSWGRLSFIGLSAIDGLIAALIAGPTAVPPEEWLPLIFADHMPSTVEGSRESRASATILARYAEVDQILTLHPQDYQPILMHHPGQFAVRPWVIGFMMGLAKRRDDWLPLLLGPMRTDMRAILECSELGRPMLPEPSDHDVQRIAAVTKPPEIAAAVLAVNSFHVARRKPRKLDTLRRLTRPPRTLSTLWGARTSYLWRNEPNPKRRSGHDRPPLSEGGGASFAIDNTLARGRLVEPRLTSSDAPR